jgi:hypothetical protein
MGKYDESKQNWKLSDRQFTKYVHLPFNNVPVINHMFQHITRYEGNKRTPNVAVAFQNVPDRMKNQIIGGSIFRMISDLGDPGVILLVQDIGSEQTNPFTSEYRTKVNDLF